MDSLTQVALGAAVGHACWHRQLGDRPALLLGGALGLLPDLDVMLYPLMDEIQKLYWHRGESHSLFFAVIGSLFFAWLFRKTRWGDKLTPRRAMAGVFLVLVTHYAIDCFNVYGTQLLAPVSRHGFQIGNMFVIDPLYTVPLLAGIIVAAIRRGPAGFRANRAGLILSSLYVVFSLAAHGYADHTFRRQLAAQNIEVQGSVTGATPLNTLLWRHVARTPDALYVGYFSLIADSPKRKIRFYRIPRNKDLVEPYLGQRNLEAIQWFSQGFWVARKTGRGLELADLRFGELRMKPEDPPDRWRFLFVWDIDRDPDILLPRPRVSDGFGAALTLLWRQLTRGQQY